MPEKEQKRYAVSVVTPCYKIKMDLFEKCFECLKKQTIGFENIEWVIVSHNSSDEQFEEINRITAGNDNVKTFKLNNEIHSPSAPRNYGLDRATGKYVGFLDADDTYSENCLEKCVAGMRDNDAQVALFRMECVCEDPMGLGMKQLIYFDQTKELIVLEKGKWDSKKLIYAAALNVTSKMYDLDYINSLHLRFDNEVPTAEDVNFNLTAFPEADRICILPQLIGYRYWMNGGSVLQTFNMPAEGVLRFAKGFRIIIENGLSHNLEMDSIMADMLGYESAVLLASNTLTLEDRNEVLEILGKYLKIMKPVEVSKIHTKQQAAMVSKLPKFVIGKPKTVMRLLKLTKLLGVDLEDKIKGNANG